MPRLGFEATIPAFERAKTVHALGRAASVIGSTTTLHACTSLWVIKYENWATTVR
jgi:hypothetical protein